MAMGHAYMYQNFPPPTIPTIPPDFDFHLPHGSDNDTSAKDGPSGSVIPEICKSLNTSILDPSQSGVRHQDITPRLPTQGRPGSASIESQSSLGRATTQPPATGRPPIDALGHFTSTSRYGNSNDPYSLRPSTTPLQFDPMASQLLQPAALPSRGQLPHAGDDVEVDDLVGDDLNDLPNESDGADELDELDDAEFIVYDEMYGV